MADERADLLARAHAAWPALAVDDAAFLVHAEACAARAHQPLSSLEVGDLLLAFACARNDAAALGAFDALFQSSVMPALRQVLGVKADIDDAAQRLRERFLVGAEPRILEFTGLGPLGAWLRVAAMRLGLDTHRQQRNRDQAEHKQAQQPQWRMLDSELEILRQRYASELEQALRQALGRLDVEQRSMLALHYLEGVTLVQIGKMRGVDASTVSRWLSRARNAVLDATREELQRELRLSAGSAESLMRLCESRLDITFGGLRGKPRD